MKDIEKSMMLLNQNKINYRVTEIYGTEKPYNECDHAIWLNVGHLEFDKNGMLTNVVTY